MSSTDFKWKVMYYSNINGQEKKIEKDFTSQDEMNAYMQENDLSFQSPFANLPFWSIWLFDSWFDSLFDRKITSLWFSPERQSWLYNNDWFAELQRRKEQIEQQERENEKKKSFLQKRLDDWKELKEFFSWKNDKDAVTKAEQGIRDCEDQLKNY